MACLFFVPSNHFRPLSHARIDTIVAVNVDGDRARFKDGRDYISIMCLYALALLAAVNDEINDDVQQHTAPTDKKNRISMHARAAASSSAQSP